MDSSLGFGSTPSNYAPYSDLLSLRLRFSLNLAGQSNSLTHYAKGTRSHHKDAPTACRHQVSGLFHSPRRGSFRLSLTVLVRYRSSDST